MITSRGTIWHGIGVPVHDLPLAVLAAEDRRDAQRICLWLCPADCGRRVLDSGDVGQVAAGACRDDLVLELFAVGKSRCQPLERGGDVGPAALGQQSTKDGHWIAL